MRVERSIDELFATYYVALVRLAVHLVDDQETAEDLVQDVFTALRPTRELDDAKRYLTTAVVNRSRSALRRRRVVRAFAAGPRRQDFVSAADERALHSAERARVLAAIAQLPRRQRDVIVLRYYEELSVAEIARVLGTSAGAVSSALSRALAALATTVGDRDAD